MPMANNEKPMEDEYNFRIGWKDEKGNQQYSDYIKEGDVEEKLKQLEQEHPELNYEIDEKQPEEDQEQREQF